MYHTDLENVIKCPICSAILKLDSSGKSLCCCGAKRHCFDISAKGHVNFALGHSGGGDSKEAVRSRSSFLEKGYYRPFADALCDLLSGYVNEGATVIDAGCGEGYYTNNIMKTFPNAIGAGIDFSKYALINASKGKKELKKICEFGINFDERVADGYYFAKSVKLLQYIFDNPELLEDDASTKIDMKEIR